MPRDPRELLEANLRAIAEDRGIGLDEVAARARITPAQLLEIFSGQYDPDLQVIEALATAVGAPISALFFDPFMDLRFH